MTVTYTYKYSTDDTWTGEESNSEVVSIYNNYKSQDKILGIYKTTQNGVTTCTVSFADSDAYTEWFAEIDAIDTTPPTGVTYVGDPIEPF